MLYKLGKVSDLRKLPISEDSVVPIVEKILNILDKEYGENRNIEEDDGGYILYASYGTKPNEFTKYFNYEKYLCEEIELRNGYAIVTYLLNNEYSVTLVLHKEDLPEMLRKELED